MPELRASVTVPDIDPHDDASWEPLLSELERSHGHLGPVLAFDGHRPDADVVLAADAPDEAAMARIAVDAVVDALRAVGLGDRWPVSIAIEDGDEA